MSEIGEVRFVSKEAKSMRVIVARLLPGTDLVAGIKAVCAEHKVTSGTIASCLGSLKFGRFSWVLPDPFAKMGFSYCPPVVIPGPVEFVAGQGTVGVTGDGKMTVHLHAVMTDSKGVTWSGHMHDEGNLVYATIELVIHAYEGVTLVRPVDAETGLTLFRPE
ncbi:MAG: DUF296 domain-containing protein [Synergistaceae bacterium]|jgi:predicted DNA-binding protein with PD1-like motif|nr:DUF296 domain-containing protein [Synergistaceae bacterium]